MESSTVMSRVKAMLEETFREPVYVDRIPKDFQRPSFAVELQKTEYQDMNLMLVRKTATILITCFVEVDAYYDSSREELNRRQDTVMGLFARGFLDVGDRHPAAMAARGQGNPDFSEVTLTVTWSDDRPGYTAPEETAPLMEHAEVSGTIPAGGMPDIKTRGE